MSFNILYVENRDRDWEPIEKAVADYNEKKKNSVERLLIERARTPEELNDKLGLRFDLILADVYFDDMEADITQDIDDRLDDIIKYVEDWRARQPLDRSLPIIAYTGMGPEALRSCLRRRHSLYDIWDKNTALPEYVAWRLSKLSIEVSRGRPDAKMQQLIAEMEKGTGATWHSHVVAMTRQYDSGWTERDQIERAGEAIEQIAHSIRVSEESALLWRIMKEWEWTGRAASPKARGHARHVINVFWLGYYLLHEKQLSGIFKKLWRGTVAQRQGMNPVAQDNPLEALSGSWFFAGLFHDIGGCVEKVQAVADSQVGLVKHFWPDPIEVPRPWTQLVGSFKEDILKLIGDFDKPVKDNLTQIMSQGLERGAVDHGLIAAMHLRRVISREKEACLAREAARAVALHNLFPELPRDVAESVTWVSEPLACLLLLCDQLQTWDRERGDVALKDEDWPQRAELAALKVDRRNGKPLVTMTINYIAPVHVLRSPEIYTRVENALERILREKPDRALRRIGKPWPFKLTVQSSLSGRILGTKMVLGDKED
jgi:hypothetical protein